MCVRVRVRVSCVLHIYISCFITDEVDDDVQLRYISYVRHFGHFYFNIITSIIFKQWLQKVLLIAEF